MNNEEKILSILESVQADVSALKTDVSALKTDVSALKTDVSALKVGQAKLEAGQKSIRKDIRDLSVHVHEGLFKGEIMRLDRRIDKLADISLVK